MSLSCAFLIDFVLSCAVGTHHGCCSYGRHTSLVLSHRYRCAWICKHAWAYANRVWESTIGASCSFWLRTSWVHDVCGMCVVVNMKSARIRSRSLSLLAASAVWWSISFVCIVKALRKRIRILRNVLPREHTPAISNLYFIRALSLKMKWWIFLPSNSGMYFDRSFFFVSREIQQPLARVRCQEASIVFSVSPHARNLRRKKQTESASIVH